MKIVLLVLGVVAALLGLHWIGQGTGLFIWPANPVMDNNINWVYYGAGSVVVGLVCIFWSRR
jgi:hypothetical protein